MAATCRALATGFVSNNYTKSLLLRSSVERETPVSRDDCYEEFADTEFKLRSRRYKRQTYATVSDSEYCTSSVRGPKRSTAAENPGWQCIGQTDGSGNTAPIPRDIDKPTVTGGKQLRNSNKYSKPTASELREVFEICDEDDDGFISAKDLRGYMSRVGFKISEEEAAVVLKSVNHNDDGTIDLQQFVVLYESLCDEDFRL